MNLLCPNCDSPVRSKAIEKDGRLFHRSCGTNAYEYEGRIVSRQRVYQLRRKAEGLCENCGEARGRFSVYCDACQVKHNELRRRRLSIRNREAVADTTALQTTSQSIGGT